MFRESQCLAQSWEGERERVRAQAGHVGDDKQRDPPERLKKASISFNLWVFFSLVSCGNKAWMIPLLAHPPELPEQLDEGDVLKDVQSLQFSPFVQTSIPEGKISLQPQELRCSIT